MTTIFYFRIEVLGKRILVSYEAETYSEAKNQLNFDYPTCRLLGWYSMNKND